MGTKPAKIEGENNILFNILNYAGFASLSDVFFAYGGGQPTTATDDIVPEPVMKYWMVQILKILLEMEYKNVIHGDLHGGNMVLSDNGEVRLIDFDHSRFHDGKSEVD